MTGKITRQRKTDSAAGKNPAGHAVVDVVPEQTLSTVSNVRVSGWAEAMWTTPGHY
jgi:hypothetical protein